MYKLLSSKNYLEFIIKNRISIFIIISLISIFSLFHINMDLFAKNESQFWIQHISNKNTTDLRYISKITVTVPAIDETNLNNVNTFEHYITESGLKSDSIFNQKVWYKGDSGEGSESIEIANSSNMDYLKLQKFIEKFEDKMGTYIDKNHIYIYVYSEEPVDFHKLINNSHLKVSIDNIDKIDRLISSSDIFIYSGLVLILVFALFFYFFKHIISGLSAVLIILITSIISVFILQIMMPNYLLHTTNILILMSIALLDYLYFYYRWHNTQYNKTSIESLEQSLNRNIMPAFLNTIITIISLTGIFFVGSSTIQAITLSLILPSIIGFVLNITFLPALLSCFKISDTNILLTEKYNKLSSKMMDYNKNLVSIFIGASTILAVFIIFEYNQKKDTLFNNNDSSILKYSIKSDERDISKVLSSFKLEEELKSKFKDIKDINSISQDLNDIVKINNGNQSSLSLDNIDEAIFFLELYGMDSVLNGNIESNILLKNHSFSKNNIIFYIESKSVENLSFIDINSNISDTKLSQINLLASSLFFALISLSVVISIAFRKRIMIFGSLFVNTLPLLAFAILLYVFNVPLSIEVFIAMAISVAILSDSTIHFMYAYLRNRYYNQSKDKSLQMMILFSGTPLLISTFVLFFTFFLLIISGIPELQKIGVYTSILLFFGMIVSLFILPIIILSSDKET